MLVVHVNTFFSIEAKPWTPGSSVTYAFGITDVKNTLHNALADNGMRTDLRGFKATLKPRRSVLTVIAVTPNASPMRAIVHPRAPYR
jgi:hypothetical protein